MLATVILLICLTLSSSDIIPAQVPAFRPEIFFSGVTRGEGTLKVRGKPPKRFSVESRGRMESGDVFRLDQSVTFADGAVESRTWQIRRLTPNRYSANLSDAAGSVSAETSGNLFHLRYLLRRPAIYMEQWLYLQPDGRTVLNIGKVKIFGLVLAQISETIVRDR
ncbi:MAG: DUF3833 family protein [Gemmatimonadales bacterium]